MLNRVLAEIAKKHAQVKFVKIRAKTAVPDWPDGNLPAAYLYKDGSMHKQLVVSGNCNGAAAVHGVICGEEAC